MGTCFSVIEKKAKDSSGEEGPIKTEEEEGFADKFDMDEAALQVINQKG